jgi:hypothetical protein
MIAMDTIRLTKYQKLARGRRAVFVHSAGYDIFTRLASLFKDQYELFIITTRSDSTIDVTTSVDPTLLGMKL